MASILPPSTEGAKELAKLWDAGQHNHLPRSVTIRVVALRIIELIATRQIPVPDQSLCLLGAVRVYYKLSLHLKKDIMYLNETMLSIDFIQKKIERHSAKIQQQANAGIQSKIKKGLIKQKNQPKGQHGLINPSPSTTLHSSLPDDQLYDERQHLDPFNIKDSLNLINPISPINVMNDDINNHNMIGNQNYDFDYMNPLHQMELIGALEDIDQRGHDELAYLYNMGQVLKTNPSVPQSNQKISLQEQKQKQQQQQQQQFDPDQDINDFLMDGTGLNFNQSTTSTTTSTTNNNQYNMNGTGIMDHSGLGFGQSFINRSNASAVVVRDAHGNIVNNSRLSIGGGDANGAFGDDFDLKMGQNYDQHDFSAFGGLGGLEFDDFSSSQGDVQFDPMTGLPIPTTFQQQKQQQQQQQLNETGQIKSLLNQSNLSNNFNSTLSSLNNSSISQVGVNPSVFQGINEFLFNIVVGPEPSQHPSSSHPSASSQNLISQPSQRPIRQRKKQQQAQPEQSQQPQKNVGEDAENSDEADGMVTRRKKANIIASTTSTTTSNKQSQQSRNRNQASKVQLRPNVFQRRVNGSDVDVQISLVVPSLDGNYNNNNNNNNQNQYDQHYNKNHDDMDLYYSDYSDPYNAQEHVLSSEGSEIMVRDFHPMNAGGIGRGSININHNNLPYDRYNFEKFTANNSFANPVALNSPFKSPHVPRSVQLPRSQFAIEFDELDDLEFNQQQQQEEESERDIMSGNNILSQHSGLDSDNSEQIASQRYDLDEFERQPQQPKEQRYSLAQPLHQQEQFDFSFLSTNSNTFSRQAASSHEAAINELTFLEAGTTTNKASVVELFDLVGTTNNPKLARAVVNAQKKQTKQKNSTISISTPNQHKLQLITSLQHSLVHDISHTLPISTLVGLKQPQSDSFDRHSMMIHDDYDDDNNDENDNHHYEQFDDVNNFNLTHLSKRSRHSNNNNNNNQNSTQLSMSNKNKKNNKNQNVNDNNNDQFEDDIDNLDHLIYHDFHRNNFLDDGFSLQDSIEEEIDAKFSNYHTTTNLTIPSLSSTFQSYFNTNPSNQPPLQALISRNLETSVLNEYNQFMDENGYLYDDNNFHQAQPLNDSNQPLLSTNATSTIASMFNNNITTQANIHHLQSLHNPTTKPIVQTKPLTRKNLLKEQKDKALAVLAGKPTPLSTTLAQLPALEDFDPSLPPPSIQIPTQYPDQSMLLKSTQGQVELYSAPLANPMHIPNLSTATEQFHPTLHHQQHNLIENEFTYLSSLPSILHELPFEESTLNPSLMADRAVQDQINYTLLRTQSTQMTINNLTHSILTHHHQQEQQINHQLPLPILPPKLTPGGLDGATPQLNLILQKFLMNDMTTARQIILNNRKCFNTDLWLQQRMVIGSKQLPPRVIEPPKADQVSNDDDNKTSMGQDNDDDNVDQMGLGHNNHDNELHSDISLNSDDFLFNPVQDDQYYTHSMFNTGGGDVGMQNFLPQQKKQLEQKQLDNNNNNNNNRTQLDNAFTQQQFMHYDGDVNIDFALNSTSSQFNSDSSNYDLLTQIPPTSSTKNNQLNLSSIGGAKHRDQFGKILDLTALAGLDFDHTQGDSLDFGGDDDDNNNNNQQFNLNQFDNTLISSMNRHNIDLTHHSHQLTHFIEDDESGDLNIVKDDDGKKEKEDDDNQQVMDDVNNNLFSNLFSHSDDDNLSSDGSLLILSETVHDLDFWAKEQDERLSQQQQQSQQQSHEQSQEQQQHTKTKIDPVRLFSYQTTLKALGYDSKHLLHLILGMFKDKERQVLSINSNNNTTTTSNDNNDDDDFFNSIHSLNNDNNKSNTLTITLFDIISKRFDSIIAFYQKHNRKSDKITQRHVASSTFFLVLHLVKHGLIHAKQNNTYGTMIISLSPLPQEE